DGTLAEEEKPFNAKTIGKPRKKAKKYMLAFHKAGARLIIFTVRGDVALVKRWAKQHDIPYHYVNENPDQPPNSSGKVFCHAYWDDRGWNALDLDEHGPGLLARIKEHKQAAAVEYVDDAWLVTPDALLAALHAAASTGTA